MSSDSFNEDSFLSINNDSILDATVTPNDPELELEEQNLETIETINSEQCEMASIKPPKSLVVNSDIDMAQEWAEWIELYTHFDNTKTWADGSAAIRASTFISCLGREGLRILNNLGATPDDKKNFEVLKKKLEDYFAPKRNKTYERWKFHQIKQQENEAFNDFLQRLQTQVKLCSYGALCDEYTIDQIVVGIRSDRTRQKLWVEDSLDFEKSKKICRADENAEKQINEIHADATSAVNAISAKSNKEFDCSRCGQRHGRRECPAYGRKCKKCQGLHHYASMCKSQDDDDDEVDEKKQTKNKGKSINKNKKKFETKKKVNAVLENDSSDDECSDAESSEYEYNVSSIRVNALSDEKYEDKWSEILDVGEKTLKVKLDTGAECNVISLKQANLLDVEIKKSVTKRIVAFNNDIVPVIGEIKIKCAAAQKEKNVVFKVVKPNIQTILGSDMCEKLGLIVRVRTVRGKDNNKAIGCCNSFEYEIDFIDEPNFKVIPARRIAHALKDKVKSELNKMVEMNIIVPVQEPSPAVSPLVIVNKGEKLRICMDPTELNKNIKRRHYPLKTVEEIAANVNGAKYFTKLDCEKGFWQIKVSERTSKYLVISTPWGRYRYLRMPFGISSAPEVFSQVMTSTLENIDNCEVAMDDIFLYADTKEKLHKITKQAEKRLSDAGFTLNKNKCEYGKKRVKFLGHIFSANGYEADPDKIEAINKLKVPTNVKELQRLLGMVTYLSKFIKNLSNITEPLRKLLVKEVAWFWDSEQQEAFANIKKALTTTPVLGYYDVNKEVKLSVDASSTALGACLLQNGKPVAYATRALTKAEKNYPQIEKEATAIRFACKKFHEYVYGKSLVIESDHKPLESIFKKPLMNAPMRLQRILWDVLQYSPKIVYTKGTDIPLADALSRDCDNEQKHEQPSEPEQFQISAIFAINEKTKQHLTKLTAEDLELQLLKAVIHRGWPEDDKKLPESVKKYATIKDEISEEDGLLFKSNKVIVPRAEIGNILRDIHKGHPGVTKSLARARQSLYWCGQSKDIKNFVERCSVCERTQKSKTKEPLLQKVIPDYPFQNVSSDLFHFKGHEYLLIADHYSGFMDFQKLRSTTSTEVVYQLKKWFSVHGIPEKLETDGGPQYTSKTFDDFVKRWQIEHIKSSPHYARSNGFAERNVQTAKNLLKKCWYDGSDVHEALVMLRNTPRNDTLGSPAQRLFSRNLRTFIPTEKEKLKPKVMDNVTRELAKLRFQQKIYADKISSPFKQLEVNEKVRMKVGHREWIPATVVEKTKFPRSVIVETTAGKKYRRNNIHLQRTKANIPDLSYDTDVQTIPENIPLEEPAAPAQPPVVVPNNGDEIRTRSGRLIKKPERYQA